MAYDSSKKSVQEGDVIQITSGDSDQAIHSFDTFDVIEVNGELGIINKYIFISLDNLTVSFEKVDF
jgi:hypothetical protein